MPLVRVDVRQAGSDAVGILVPPGARTIVVVRPRLLAWDLLAVRWDGDAGSAPAFASFDRDAAARTARDLGKFLEAADASGVRPVETLGRDGAYQVWIRADALCWLACERLAKGGYRPALFADLASAQAAGEQLASRLLPGPGRTQTYYFNTQNFAE